MPRLEKFVLHDDNPAPSLRDRIGGAWRSLILGPWNPRDPQIAKYFGGSPVSSGVAVNETVAFGVSAFYCAVTTISADVASLPLFLYRTLPNGGKEKFDQHPLFRLLHSDANPQTTSYQLRQTLMLNLLTSGNAFAEVVRDNANRPVELWHVAADRVQPFLDGGQLRYRIHQPQGRDQIVLDARNMIHLRGPSPDGVLGLDMVRVARQAIGISVAAETFAGSFFANSATMGGVLTSPGTLPDLVRKNLRESIEARHRGADQAHKLLLLENGVSFTGTATNQRDAQYHELRTHQVREICRFFRLPPHKAGDLADATFSNVEQMNLDYLTGCLRPHLVNIEQEFSSKLIASSERRTQSIEHSVEGFLRADSEKRAQYYATMTGAGIMTIDECRRLENLPPVPGGSVPRVPLNFEPLTGSKE